MIFWKSKLLILLALSTCALCENEDDTTNAFMEAAQALFENKEAIGGLQGVANAFMQSDTGKQVLFNSRVVCSHSKSKIKH